MKPIETKKEYSDYVDQKSPNSPILKNCFNAFLGWWTNLFNWPNYNGLLSIQRNGPN